LLSGSEWRVLEEGLAALLGFRTTARQARRRSSVGVEQQLKRTEETGRLLKLRDALEFLRAWFPLRLRVVVNCIKGLTRKARLASVEHQDGIERRRVERGGHAASEDHRASGRVVEEADVRRQRDSNQDGRLRQHAGNAVSLPVVA